MLIRQIKLRTFFSLIYLFVVVTIGTYFFYAYNQYKQHLTESISQKIMTLHDTIETIFIPIIDTNSSFLIKTILAEVPNSSPFVKTISLSLDNHTILFSSDKKQINQPLPEAILVDTKTIISDIFTGKTSFYMPIKYFHNKEEMRGSLILTLDAKAVSSNNFLQKVYANFLFSGICIILSIGILFLLIRHYLVLPLYTFETLALEEKIEKPFFFINDLERIYNRLLDTYRQLSDKEKSLQTALYLQDYLNEILRTIESVNRLLISDKSIQEIMDESCKILAHHGQYNLAWIGNVVDESIDIVAHSDDPTGYVQQLNLSLNASNPTSKGPSAQSVLTNKTILTQSVNLEYYHIWQNKAKSSGISSSICLPLRESANKKPFATLAIYSSRPFGFMDEEITMLEGLAGDLAYGIISRMKKEQLRLVLITDPLTGLSNRASLLEQLRNCDNPKLLLININRFRDINTVYGFDAGDFILRSCAESFKTEIMKNFGDIFRLHSDTFAILLKESETSMSAELLVQKLSLQLADYAFSFNGIDILLSISAGFSDTVEQTIENAEIALKLAKEHKLLFQQFSPSMRTNKEHEENIAWYKIIKDAIKEERLVPFFQAIIHNESGAIGKYEALVRIIMPDGSIVAPFKFLDIAKKTGLYSLITQAIITKTIANFKESPYIVSINLSTLDITNADTVAFLRNSIIESSIGNRLVFEILESEEINNYDEVSAFIDEFRQLGCQFAIDDFGSGFSNFEHLTKLQVDFLKIDGSLIKNLPHDKNAQIVVKNIQNFAFELGIATIAEFVSSQEIAEIVKRMRITYSQGYYFSEPMQNIFTPHNPTIK